MYVCNYVAVLVGINGLCSNATKKNIMFPISEMTSCHMQLDLTKFKDCSKLR